MRSDHPATSHGKKEARFILYSYQIRYHIRFHWFVGLIIHIRASSFTPRRPSR